MLTFTLTTIGNGIKQNGSMPDHGGSKAI